MVGVAGGGGVMAAAGMLKGRVVVALYTYQGSEFGDMTFSKGDQMEIVDDTDPDWYYLIHSLSTSSFLNVFHKRTRLVLAFFHS